jgi:hypothetical protein
MFCRKCEYNLQGNEGTCPECGTTFDPGDAHSYLHRRASAWRKYGWIAILSSLTPLVAHVLIMLSFGLTRLNLGRWPRFGDRPIDNVGLDMLAVVAIMVKIFAVPIAFVVTVAAVIAQLAEPKRQGRPWYAVPILVSIIWWGSTALSDSDPLGAIYWIRD